MSRQAVSCGTCCQSGVPTGTHIQEEEGNRRQSWKSPGRKYRGRTGNCLTSSSCRFPWNAAYHTSPSETTENAMRARPVTIILPPSTDCDSPAPNVFPQTTFPPLRHSHERGNPRSLTMHTILERNRASCCITTHQPRCASTRFRIPEHWHSQPSPGVRYSRIGDLHPSADLPHILCNPSQFAQRGELVARTNAGGEPVAVDPAARPRGNPEHHLTRAPLPSAIRR